MGKEDYPLEEFVVNLANAEERYAREIMSMVECFYKSRIDLPAQRLEDIGKCHLRTSRYLRKVVDPKKSELVNLWKICNTFSIASVEVDNAMREVRKSIRKNLKKEILTKPEPNKRYKGDLPPKKQYLTETGPTESYDFPKPKSWAMKFPFDFRDRKAKRMITVSNIVTTPPFEAVSTAKSDSVLRPSSLYSTCSSSSEEPKLQNDRENSNKIAEDKEDVCEQPVAPVRMSKMKQPDQQPQQHQQQPIAWMRSISSDPSAYKPDPYPELYYSNNKNIINVPVQSPRLQTRINIGDPDERGPAGVLAQTHSIQIYQERKSST